MSVRLLPLVVDVGRDSDDSLSLVLVVVVLEPSELEALGLIMIPPRGHVWTASVQHSIVAILVVAVLTAVVVVVQLLCYPWRFPHSTPQGWCSSDLVGPPWDLPPSEQLFYSSP